MRCSRLLYRLTMTVSVLGTIGPFGYLMFYLSQGSNMLQFAGRHQPLSDKHYWQLSKLSSKKLILDWTGFFGTKMSNRYFNGCPDLLKKCELVGDRRLSNISAAILFHLPDLIKGDKPIIRHLWQRYVYFIHESAANFPGYAWHNDMLFNWTMTMRYDSDIPWPYGLFTDRRGTIKAVDYELLLSSKHKDVVWMVSHCPTHSLRERYVPELQKHIPVDVYGSCGTLQCPKSKSLECRTKMDVEYKFILAFENSFCCDYVTEKVWHILNGSHLIPVLLKSSHVEHLLPYHSYISAEDFSSAKDLADYLIRVGSDPKLFESYFRWRDTQEIQLDSERRDLGICQLCQKLWDSDSPKKYYQNVYDWWVSGSQCDNNFVYKYLKKRRFFFF